MTTRLRNAAVAVALLAGGLAAGGWAATAASEGTDPPEEHPDQATRSVAAEDCSTPRPTAKQDRSTTDRPLPAARMDQVRPGLAAVPQ